MSDEKPVYHCIFCGRGIVGEPQEDGGNLYVHDEVPHPVEFNFDDEATMQ